MPPIIFGAINRLVYDPIASACLLCGNPEDRILNIARAIMMQTSLA